MVLPLGLGFGLRHTFNIYASGISFRLRALGFQLLSLCCRLRLSLRLRLQTLRLLAVPSRRWAIGCRRLRLQALVQILALSFRIWLLASAQGLGLGLGLRPRPQTLGLGLKLEA